jgi:hypothetical protein
MDSERLLHVADMPGGSNFTRPPDELTRGVSRMRSSNAPAWRGPLSEAEHFNETVHCQWMCVGTRAYNVGETPWGTGAVDTTARVVNDALVMVDRAYRLVMVVPAASHAEYSDCVERWVHTYGAMCTLAADGEPANHLRVHYCISEVVIAICDVAGISVGTHWPLAALHAADVLNVMPRSVLAGRCAREALEGAPPDVRHFRVFGCAAVVLALGSYELRGLLTPPGVMPACTSAPACGAA